MALMPQHAAYSNPWSHGGVHDVVRLRRILTAMLAAGRMQNRHASALNPKPVSYS